MPPDSGAVTQFVPVGAVAAPVRTTEGLEPYMSGGVGFGGALRVLRESRGLSLQDVADATRVRRAYLSALEDMRLDQLPSRPFVIGYVRAYAQALRVDPDEAVAKFKEHAPADGEALRAPVGVERGKDPRLSVAAIGAVIVVSGVLVWNLAQHALASEGRPSPTAPAGAPAPAPKSAQGAVSLAAPQPAPADSDVPKPYVTPGMAIDGQDAAAPAPVGKAASRALVLTADSAPLGAAFAARGQVYGAPADQTALVIQARKPASVIIRGADGSVYFARQLAAGEAYRAPSTIKGLVIDASNPQAFDVFMNGQLAGQLAAPQTPLAKILG